MLEMLCSQLDFNNFFFFFGHVMQHVGSSSLTRDQTHALCIESVES